jgi:zinc D-Ala-D-Ala carboxypeptidase
MRLYTKIATGFCAASLLMACGHDEPKHEKATKHEAVKKTANKEKNKQTAKDNQDSNATVDSSQISQTGIIVINNPKSILALVNKTHKLPDGYIPDNLVYPNVPFPYADKIEKREMRADAAAALEKMFAAASDAGFKLFGESGYRSYKRQVSVYQHNVETLGEAKANVISAQPGTSEHQTGLAMDLTSEDMLTSPDPLTQTFGDTDAGQWVANNAYRFGFIIRYPKDKESITGYEYEPWHVRYVGKKAATYIYQHHLTLEQYIASQKANSK